MITAPPLATLPTPRTDTAPMPAVRPAFTTGSRTPPWLATTKVHTCENGHVTADGTVGEHAAGLLEDTRVPRLPETDGDLIAELTVSMQTYAAIAPAGIRYAELIPFLAQTLVTNGWVTAEALT
jgi:hypothetical protein